MFLKQKDPSIDKQKKLALQNKDSKSEIDSLKSELKEVKDLLHQLLKNNGT